MLTRRALLAIVIMALCMTGATRAQEVRVAAAADLEFAMQDVAAQFEKHTGTKVDVTYGSSGNFFSQLQNGAPFDLFFSADIDYPRKLEAAGLAEPGTLYQYAVGRIAIWTPADAKVDVASLGWKALLDASVQKIAIANPEHAPYGRAAVEALKKAGIYDQVKPKLVFGENISQTAQFVQSGSAQAGIVALSLAVSPAMKDGQRWEIPSALYRPLEQGVVILESSTNQQAAHAFLRYLRTPEAQALLMRYGFSTPPVDAGTSHNP